MDAVDIELVEMTPADLEDVWGQVLDVYRHAFGQPPYKRGEIHVLDFSGALARQMEREQFKFAAARQPEDGKVVGFAYGYTCQPGQWWHDTIVRIAGPDISERWLAGAFELVEFAVLPAYQGQGIGGRLHDFTLTGLSQPRAVLSTMQVDTPAYRLYIHRGWQVLIESFSFPGVTRAYRIMGKVL